MQNLQSENRHSNGFVPTEDFKAVSPDFVKGANSGQEAQNDDAGFFRVLSEINKLRPDEKVLFEYFNSSNLRDVKVVNFAVYFEEFAESTKRENELKRRALRMILFGENYRRKIENNLESAASSEVLIWKDEMQALRNDLQKTINFVTGDRKEERISSLSVAAKNLVEARNRLDFAQQQVSDAQNQMIADSVEAAKKDEQSEVKAEKTTVEEKSVEVKKTLPEKAVEEPKTVSFKGREPMKVNLVLVGVTVLIVLFGAGYTVYPFLSEAKAEQSVQQGEAVDVDFKKFPGSEQLVVARVSSNTLIAVVNADWQSLSTEKKQENLKALQTQGRENQFKSVLLFDSRGEIVGRASGQEVEAK